LRRRSGCRRTSSTADGDPRALKRLRVQFRGMGIPEQEITVSGTVTALDDETATVDLVASQGENQIIRNAQAEIRL
jgi:hypothetical protein